jgi:signal transduction histidine kinase
MTTASKTAFAALFALLALAFCGAFFSPALAAAASAGAAIAAACALALTAKAAKAENAFRAAQQAEVELFTGGAAHDLRSPLSGIEGLCGILAEDYAAQLPADAKKYMARIAIECARMKRLVEALHEMSALTRHEMSPKRADISELAARAITAAAEKFAGRTVKNAVPAQTFLECDPELMLKLLGILLDNALKFSAGAQQPEVTVGCDRAAGGLELWVRDNGAGFDMKYAAKLFRPFQRLHDPTRFPGPALGLATAKRIAERHGGAMRAEGEDGKGAKFTVMLPRSR